MKKDILLSIVVPVYNVEKYLDECLKSIINNYQEGVEVILVDDGSKDSSPLICDKYEKEYEYIMVLHKENGGLSSARNAGIRKANGKYIWFVDSDDYIKDGSIKEIINASLKDTDLVMVSHCNIYPNGEVINDYLEEPKENEKEPYVYFYNKGSASYAATRFIAKKRLIEENSLFFTEGIYHEDEDWSPRVLCSAKNFAVVKESVYCYRVGNPKSIMGMLNPKKVYDKIFVSKNLYNKIRRDNAQGIMRSFLQYRVEHNYVTALNELEAYSGEENKKMTKELKDNLYLLEDINSNRAKLVRNVVKLIGIKNTSKLLRLRNRIK
ncbi:glycosyltransferase [Clostridium isatidis]|uniref:Glycosyltransferase 2-like domain-containing protein n=1 Tax=Clostridium isatidis TaxID=182773 RepID=A0A343JDE1_9CLOT|nr:glycosyltransferase [Clostridium isatidis]ASW43549.1 hypothetical protein BEN51_08655 [Clostridium isatidis]